MFSNVHVAIVIVVCLSSLIIVVTSPKRTHVDWNWHISREKYLTSSNHRLESAGLKALEALLFKMLGIEKMVMRALF